MNARDWAVRQAAMGFRVFRIRFGTKGGDGNFIDPDWKNTATADVLAVHDMWSGPDGEPLNHNIGVLATGAVFLDVDRPKMRAKGLTPDGFASLPSIGPLPKTYSVRTPSGGTHFYFDAGGQGFGQADIAPGINVRAVNGYVVGAGSTFIAKEPGDVSGTYVMADEAPMAPLPSHVAEKLRSAALKTGIEGVSLVPLDTPAAIEAARAWLTRAPEAVEGHRNNVGFGVSAQLHDFGLSVDTVREFLSEWNDAKVFPPLDDDELDHLAWSGSKHRQNQRGIANPTHGFDDVTPPTAAEEQAEGASRFGALVRRYTATDETDAKIPPRPWIVPGRVIREAVTLVGGFGSVGKSMWSLQLAAAVATIAPADAAAHPLAFDVRENVPVLVINNEDPDDELDRRLAAVVQHFGVDRARARENIHLFSGHGSKLKVARKQGKSGAIVDGEYFADLCHYITANKIGVVIFDPLVSVHECAENDNSEMQRVMERLTLMAARTKAAVVCIHHTNKPPAASSESYAGNVNSIRGASAIKDASRISVTMFGMSEKDAEKFKVPEKDRGRFVRVDDAKANLHLASPDAEWFRKETVQIGNGESLGVLVKVDLKARRSAPAGSDPETALVIEKLGEFTADEIRMSAAIAKVHADPLFRERSRDYVAKAVKSAVEASKIFAGEWSGATGGIIRAV